MSDDLTRRELLVGAAALTTTGLVGTGCGAEDEGPDAARIRALLEQWFGPGELGFMAELGAVWAAELDGAGVELELERGVVAPGTDETDAAVLERWRAQLDEAFASDEVELVRGYCLGRTEAQLCLVAASLA